MRYRISSRHSKGRPALTAESLPTTTSAVDSRTTASRAGLGTAPERSGQSMAN